MINIKQLIKGAEKPFPQDKTLMQLFEEQVVQTPNNVALRFYDQEVTYLELNQQANQLARFIRSLLTNSMTQNTIVAVSFEKSLEMIVAILAILKAGASYLPIDVNCPSERAQFILEEAEVTLLLTQSHLKNNLKNIFGLDSSSILAVDNKFQNSFDKTNFYVNTHASDLAYVIYTSGTSGFPKGIMVEHHSVVNMAMAHAEELKVNENSVVLQFASLFFDASVWEIFTTLLQGGCLTIIPENIRQDPVQTVNFLERENISVAAFSPAFLAEFPVRPLPTLEVLMVGGETPSEQLIKNWSQGRCFINAYGPTETTVCASLNHYQSGDALHNIGKPLQNFVLAVTEQGELLIAGAGLARGYLKQGELTAKRFITVESLGRCYRTGDKVQLQQDGTLLFSGRFDFQIKHHGFRFELTEIEQQLLQYPAVQNVCVLLQKQAQHEFLVAFYRAEIPLSEDELLHFLATKLPDYMLPSCFVYQEKFPITANGKLNRKAFPKIEMTAQVPYEPPGTNQEKQIQKIWQQAFGISRLGVSEDFFCLGGSSILAMQVLKQVNQQLASELSLVDFYQARTIKRLASVIANQPKKEIMLSETEEVMFSPGERMILRDHFASESNLIYNESLVVDLPKCYSSAFLKRQLKALIKLFPNLRTNYQFAIEGMTKTIAKKAQLNFIKRSESTEEDFSKAIEKLVQQPFDLANECLIRFYCFEINGQQKLLIVFFHAIMDGSSVVNVLLSTLKQLLDKQKINHKFDYKQAQQSFCQHLTSFYQENYDSKLTYWKNLFQQATSCQLADLTAVEPGVTGDQVAFTIDSDNKQQLVYCAEKTGVSLFDLLLAMFFLLLKRYSQQTNLMVRTNIDERVYLPDYADVPGCFINNTFLLTTVNEELTVAEFVRQVAVNKQQGLANGLSYEQLLIEFRDELEKFSTIHFNIEPEAQDESSLFQTQTLVHSGQVKNDLYFELDIKQDKILARVEYKDKLFSSNLIERLITSYQLLIKTMPGQLASVLKQLPTLTAGQYKQLVDDWNETEYDFTGPHDLVSRFQQQVINTPQQPALIFSDKVLTYEALDQQSNQLAHYLQKHLKLEPYKPAKQFIALCLERDPSMLIAILAVLKLGAAYVPIDPQLPKKRISYLLKDSQPICILTQSLINLPATVERFNLNELNCFSESTDPLAVDINPDSLAYVIYTSGTTGQPKGVMLTHKAVVNRIAWMQKQYPITEQDTVLQKTPYSFDVSVWEFFWAHWQGAKLVMLEPEGHKDADYLLKVMQQKQVTVMHFVPSLLEVFLENLTAGSVNALALRHVFCSGEALSSDLVRRFNDCFIAHGVQLHNLYGPTEAAIDVSFYDCPKTTHLNFIPIGQPINNIRLYILDEQLNPVPVGMTGELYISGLGLAQGYLNKPELTTERFITNAFYHSESDQLYYQKMYKTGDLARYLSDGNIEYLGRNDFQVKLRGLRIELGDIEAALLEIPEITQVCVLLNEQQLYAFYKGSQVLDQTHLQQSLLERLPEYMVPNYFIAVQAMPLTANGKLDRAALLTKRPKQIVGETAQRVNTPLEAKLITLWQILLGHQQLSSESDFFGMGGDSIIAIRLVNRLKQAGFACRVADIFQYRSISSLANFLVRHQANELENQAEQTNLSGTFDLLPIQQWFFNKVSQGRITNANHFNQAFWVKVGSIDLKQLQYALNQLTEHHDGLRLSFLYEQGQYRQCYQSECKPPKVVLIDSSRLSEVDLQAQLTQLQSQFDLFHAPLWAIAYVYNKTEDNGKLFFAFHHLLIDTFSWQVLIEDLKSLYCNKNLQEKTTSYRQFQRQLKHYSESRSAEKNYWRTECELIRQHDDKAISRDQFSEMTLNLTLDTTQTLFSQVNEAYQTETQDLLLTAFVQTLAEAYQTNQVAVTLEGHGREELVETTDLSRTVGWFTSVYPVCFKSDEIPGAAIQLTKEKLRSIPDKGIGFGVFAYLEGDLLLAENLPDVYFNYLGDLGDSSKRWSITTQGVGQTSASDNQFARLLDANLWVKSGQLYISVVSTSSDLEADRIAEQMKQRLEILIKDCLEVIDSGNKYFTSSDFPLVKLSPQQIKYWQKRANHLKNEIETIYPANSLQQGLLYHALSQPDDDAYQVQVLLSYDNKLDAVLYEQAWRLAIKKYPALRTAFSWDDDILQVVYKQGEFNFQYQDLSSLEKSQQEQAINELLIQDRKQGFDLTRPGLIRVYLLKRSEDFYSVVRSEHHIIMDGWSGSQLLQTVEDFYLKLQANNYVNCLEDKAYNNAQFYYAEHREQALKFWEAKDLSHLIPNDINPLLSRTCDLDKFKVVVDPATVKLKVPEKTTGLLKQLANQKGLTLSSLVQFAWHKLLQTYIQVDQTIVGTIVSGREMPVAEIESSVGLYINALPLVVDWPEDTSLLEQIQFIQDEIMSIAEYGFVNLADLQVAGKRLFHSLFIFENYPKLQHESGLLNLSLERFIEKLDYPIALIAYEVDSSLYLELTFDQSILTEKLAKQHLERLHLALEVIPEQLYQPWWQLSLLTKQEAHNLFHAWTDNDVPYPNKETILSLFEQQAQKTPDNRAIIFDKNSLTYQELDEASNQFARRITQKLNTDVNYNNIDTPLVAVYCERSLSMMIALLAVLKANAAYIPIDPNYPVKRIKTILEESHCLLLLAQNELLIEEKLFVPELEIINISDQQFI